MKQTTLFIALLLTWNLVAGQFTIKGLIRDLDTQKHLANATVILDENSSSTSADSSGSFQFVNVQPGKHVLTVRHIGYETTKVQYDVNQNLTPVISLRSIIIS